MRACGVVALLACLAPLAMAQWTAEEQTLISDTLSLGNLRPEDLNYEKQLSRASRTSSFITFALNDPLGGAAEQWRLHGSVSGATTAKLLGEADQLLGGKGNAAVLNPTTVSGLNELPASIRPIVARLVGTMQAADAEIREATKGLSAEQQRTIIEGLPVTAVEESKVTFAFVRNPAPSLANLWTLIDQVDQARIRSASITVTEAAEQAARELRAANADVPGKVRVKIGSYVVQIGGKGNDIHSETDARLTIDLGGNDTYTGRAGAGVGYTSALIDLGGDDTYRPVDLSIGAAILGIGVALDAGGHDDFGGASLAYGAGLAGVGVFRKEGGHDRYASRTLSQGFGVAGIGLCIDTNGNDVYDVGLFGQGAARTQGVGWLVDLKGNDLYRAGSISLNAPLFSGVYYSFAQGFGMGYREDWGGQAGGVGLLTDVEGNDTYLGETYSQGAAYWFSIGSLGDLAGRDLYRAHHYSQASAMHICAAYLLDASGDDTYAVAVGAAHAIGHDLGVAVLLDRAGDDTYTSRDSNPGLGSANGVGIFVDMAGADRYHGPAGRGLAARGTGSVGVFADANGDDLYRFGLADGQGRARDTWGVALDRQMPGAVVEPPVVPDPPAVGSIPRPEDAQLQAIYRRATQWGVGSAEAEVQESVRQLIGIGLPAWEWMVDNQLASAQRLEIRTFVAVARGIGAPAATSLGRKALTGSIAEKSNALRIAVDADIKDMGAVIPSFLESPELQMAAARAAGPLKAISAVPTLNRLCLSEDPILVRTSMISLAQIGAAETVVTGMALLGSSDLPTRRAAAALIAQHPDQAGASLDPLLNGNEELKARMALEVLGFIGSEDALNRIARFLMDPRPGMRIEALRQLNGRVPETARPTVLALQRDPVDLVKWVARGVEMGS